MTTINGYNIALREEVLDKMIQEQMMPIEMIGSDFEGYQALVMWPWSKTIR